MVRTLVLLMLAATSCSVWADGRCPPGQFPVGGQGMLGCAPIPGANGGTAAPVPPAAPRPTGKWETRWGALAEDAGANERGVPLATGVSESRKTKSEASKPAIAQCQSGGGLRCEVVTTYYNQCIAVADPKPPSQGGPGGKSIIYTAETAELAVSEVMKRCSPPGTVQCSIAYSACSMSEFKKF